MSLCYLFLLFFISSKQEGRKMCVVRKASASARILCCVGVMAQAVTVVLEGSSGYHCGIVAEWEWGRVVSAPLEEKARKQMDELHVGVSVHHVMVLPPDEENETAWWCVRRHW
jgi:hypothetical protein